MSQTAVNQAVRLLTSKPLKFTIKIVLDDDSVIEVQSTKAPILDWVSDVRETWVKAFAGEEQYSTGFHVIPVAKMKYMQVEENVTG